MNFMNFHNASTQSCDHHILLIMTGNAHKESCYKLLLILVRENELLKLMVAAKWWLLSQLKKKLFDGKLILRCGTAPFLFIFVILSS